jgi:hypothetical protein|tara:strand:- start:173 stop:598 length:426 start_codon:yes stop_codon:yes gene_type:complete
MSKTEDVRYKKLNTPQVTHMLNLMQMVYGDKHIRGTYDEICVDGKEQKIAPLFSALTAFVLSSALCMRMPGQEKIVLPTELPKEEVLKKIDQILLSLDAMLEQPIRGNLVSCLEKYITNGKWETTAIKDEEAEILFGKKPN